MEKIILNIIGFCIGLGLLIWGSEYLIQSSVRLAYILRWSPLFIGLILISFGTSAPEGSIGIIAALKQEKGIALGNVIGSNIANIALVLGICSMVKPIVVDRRLFSLNIPLMLISYIVFYIFCIDLVLTPFEGIILLTIFCFFCLYAYKHSSLSIEESKGIQDFKFSNFIKSIRSKSLLFLLVLVFLISIVGGANIMVNTGKNLAQILGVSNRWILQPEDEWEVVGYVHNVVFSCGAVPEEDGTLKIYWGGADKVMCVGIAIIDELVELCLTDPRPPII